MTNAALARKPTAPYLQLLMPNDDDKQPSLEPRTEPAPERYSTQPPAADNARAEAYMGDRLPRDPKLPAVEASPGSSFRQLAESELVVLYRTAIGMHESLLGASGLLEQNRRNTVEDIARVVDRGFDRVWERVEPRLSSQDRKIEGLKLELSDMRAQLGKALDRVAELERRLDEDDAARPPETPA